MRLLPPVLTFSFHHLFQYVNLFLAGVNVTLVILCLILILGFEVLDLVLQIYHSPLISLISNYPGPFVLVVILVWNARNFGTNREVIFVEIKGSRVRTQKITFLVVDARIGENFR